MKKLVLISILVFAVLMMASAGFAQTVATISPFVFDSAKGDWNEIAEVENVHSDPRISVSGSYTIFNVASGAQNSGIWQYGYGYVQTAFANTSTSLFVNFESDSNDGLASFYIDSALVYTLNTYNRGWFSVIFTGLSDAAHTLRVSALTSGDIAIDAMGSGAPTQSNGGNPVPEPMTMLLFGPALLGLLGLKRKKV